MNKITLVSICTLVMLIIFSNAFIVKQRDYAIVFQFGEAVRVIDKPGLNFKIPGIQNVEYFDKRILSVEVEAKELTAADSKRFIVDAFARFRITNPVQFYKTVFNYQGIKVRLNKILESAMREVIGRVQLMALLSDQRSDIIMQICDLVNEKVQNFGIIVIDVRILRADLPKENSAAIYRRMQTEREKEAKTIRAEGQESAARIKSEADKQQRIILATANMEAQIIKGNGDAKASNIYNIAYSQDPEFYKLYKSLMVYRNTLGNDSTSFVLSPDSQFFKFLNLNTK